MLCRLLRTMPNYRISFDGLGTQWLIESVDIDRKIDKIKLELDRIDRVWSRFRDDSLVAKMSQQTGTFALSTFDTELIMWYKELYDITNGLVTPLIGQTLSDAGYDKAYSLQPKQSISKTPKWDKVMEISKNNIVIKQPALIDVGAAGKGFAVDRVAGILGDGTYVIDASGDIRVSGASVRIGLEDPANSKDLIGVATVKNASICGSSINRRAWQTWHHVINPGSSRPTQDVIATWAIADTAMHADGLATALFFIDPQKLQDFWPFEYCIVYKDGTIKVGGGKSIELFTKGTTS